MPAASLKSNGLSRRSVLLGTLGVFQHNAEVVLLSGIEFRHLANGPSSRRFLRIHGNEETARAALENVISQAAGDAYIVTSKTRMVRIDGASLDPNRMFSRPGAEKSLLSNNPGLPTARLNQILDFLDAARPKLLANLLPTPGGILIALHNNGPGYSVESERPISQAESLPRLAEPHEFFLATSQSDFAVIARGPYNAVLQNEPAGPDDGSLSRLCARQNIRYVNLEVAHGKLEIQIQMLQWLITTLP